MCAVGGPWQPRSAGRLNPPSNDSRGIYGDCDYKQHVHITAHDAHGSFEVSCASMHKLHVHNCRGS